MHGSLARVPFPQPSGGLPLPDGSYRYLRHAVGVEHVFINGREAYNSKSGYTGIQAGEIVERKKRPARQTEEGHVVSRRAFIQPPTNHKRPEGGGQLKETQSISQ